MLISLNWLKDFVQIHDSISPEKLGRLLTLHTVEIDAIENQAQKFENFVVGKIVKITQHPNADRLRLAAVDIGEKKLNIVCGAPNIQEGQIVPVALVGAAMPAGFQIQKTKIRGEKSEGMMCSEKELGLGDDHEGIKILDENAKIGESLAKCLGLDDVIYEIDNKSLTNRPDLWGHRGIAREIAAFLGSEFNPKLPEINNSLKIASQNLAIEAREPDLCKRYMGITIANIKIASSPKWMRKRLNAVGIRPINNIVDITNYIMLDLGQPMHAFDAEKLSPKNKNIIKIRKAKKGERIKAIDGQDYKLDENTLVIADEKKPIAIAGVMGGAESQITESSAKIILECANFEPVTVRKTSQKLGLRTDSSARFEKELDPGLCETALARAIELIKEICPKSEIISNLADIQNYKQKEKIISLNLNWLGKRIGARVESKKIIKILMSLGFSAIEDKEELRVTVPSWRQKDISIPEDLLEEIARIIGYDNLEPQMPKIKMASQAKNFELSLVSEIKNILSGAPALAETYNYSFLGDDQLKKLGLDPKGHIALLNPIAKHLNKLRKSLAPNLLENIKSNQANFSSIGIFEIGKIYLPNQKGLNKDSQGEEKLPQEEKCLGIIIAEKTIDPFNKAKGIVEFLFKKLGQSVEWSSCEAIPPYADSQKNAQINIAGKNIGGVISLDEKIKNKLGVKTNAAIVQIMLRSVFEILKQAKAKKYQAPSKFPSLARDLAFVVNKKILYNDLRKIILNFDDLIQKADLFDVYEGEPLAHDEKSLAFKIDYQAERTLTGEEVDAIQAKLIKKLEKQFAARLRDF